MAVKVAYLFGAGASQGELNQNGYFKSILMRDIVFDIARRIIDDEITELYSIRNELAEDRVDVEHLITLHEASGTTKDNEIAHKLRKLFREEIQERMNDLDESFFPTLFASLIDMHCIVGLDEKLVVILTINYEDLIERAMQIVKEGINYSIKIANKGSSYSINEALPPLLKLHGSFNWKNEYPVAIVDNIGREEDILWIPPGVVKRREEYPFSVIWGRAKELLECDILRIVGCSLSRNDWELISLLYSTQKLQSDRDPYWIELIDYPDKCKEIKKQYTYLQIRPILSIPEFRDYLTKQYLSLSTTPRPVTEEDIESMGNYIAEEKQNVFCLWLQAKGDKLLSEGIPVTTSKNIFSKFIYGEL